MKHRGRHTYRRTDTNGERRTWTAQRNGKTDYLATIDRSMQCIKCGETNKPAFEVVALVTGY